jgi:endonuclease/exonuclease/phosphatase family metal-dependent hydrolase
MPKTVRILSWNIQDLGADQIADADFINFMKLVVSQESADFVSILETKSNLGATLGTTLANKLGAASWASDSSPKSPPHGNKPENYVFVWKKAVFTKVNAFIPDDTFGGGYATLKFPHLHNNPKKKSPSRFPYVGHFTVKVGASSVPLSFVAFHTCFVQAWIPEANRNLAKIPDVKDGVTNPNMVVMGDFNDHPSFGNTFKGKGSFQSLEANGKRKCTHRVNDKTSLASDFLSGWAASTDPRSKEYDNFFVRLANKHTFKKAAVVDLIDRIQKGKKTNKIALEGPAKKLFNAWVGRKTAEYAAKGKVFAIQAFGAGDNIADVEDAHEVYFNAISDHLPITLELELK